MPEKQPQSRVANNQTTTRKTKKPRNKKRPLSIWEKILIWLFALFNVALVSGALVFFYYASSAPEIPEAKLASSNSTELLDTDGHVIWSLGLQKRDYASSNQIPDQLKASVVAIEDRRFYQHGGVDVRRILGATVANLTGSSLGLQGGSTLTQQLVKLSVFSTAASDRTIKRKAQEAWLAMQVSKRYSKDQILTFYINKVYMGEGVYGMKTAARYYYGKRLDQLSIDQYALLAGMPQAPVRYDPYVNPQLAKLRRDTVLQALVESKKITPAQEQQYQNVPITNGLLKKHPTIGGATQPSTQRIVDAYAQSVLSELRQMGYKPETDGLKVYTYLNLDVQKQAYNVVNTNNYVNFPNNRLQVGLTMADPNTGAIIAQIGGRQQDAALGLNRATQTNRSAGSTVKPIVDYGPAIEYLNWPTYRTVMDKKYFYPGTKTQVHDFEGTYAGPMTMREALVQSRNVPAVETLQSVGVSRATSFIRRFGLNTTLYPSSAIGIDLSTVQEASIFGSFSNNGVYHKPEYIQKIVTQDGKTETISNKSKRVMQPSTAYMLTDMMKDVMTKSNGTGVLGHVPGTYEAGKTGTVGYADNVNVPAGAVSDRWFTGYNRNFVLSVWTGYDQPNQPGNYITPGYVSNIPLLIYKSIMGYAMQGIDSTDWVKPGNVQVVTHNGQRELMISNASFTDDPSPIQSSQPATSAPSSSSSSSSDSSSSSSESSESSSTSSESSSSESTPTSSESSSSDVPSSSTTAPEQPSSSVAPTPSSSSSAPQSQPTEPSTSSSSTN